MWAGSCLSRYASFKKAKNAASRGDSRVDSTPKEGKGIVDRVSGNTGAERMKKICVWAA